MNEIPAYPLREPEVQEEELRPIGQRIGWDEEQKIVNAVMGVKTRSEQNYAGLRTRWLDYFDHYINKPRSRTRSTIPVPLGMEHVDTTLADMMGKQFASRPFCSIIGRTLSDKQKAPLVEALLQYQYDEMDIFSLYYVVAKSALIFGVCPCRVVFDQDWIEVPVPQTGGEYKMMKYHGPKVYAFDPFDYFPDPSKIHPNDPAPSCFRLYRPYEFLEERADNYPNVYDNVHKIPHKRQANMSPDELDARRDRQSSLGMSSEGTGRGLIEIYECDVWWPEYRKDGTYIRRPYLATVANGKLIRFSRNNYISQDGNVLLAAIDRLPNQLMGMGLIAKEHANIHGANTVLDMILTNLEAAVRRKKIINTDMISKDYEVMGGQNQVVHSKGNVREAMMWEDVLMVAPDAYNVLGLFTTGSESAGGVKPIIQGDIMPGETATATLEAMKQGGSRLNLYMLMMDNTFVKWATSRMHKINQQFLELPMLVPILEKDASQWPVVDMKTLAINPNFVPEAATRELNRQVNIAQIEKFLMIVSKIEALYPIIPSVIGKLAREFRWQEAPQIEQLSQQAINQYLMMSQMASGEGGGGVPMNQIADHGNSSGVNATNTGDMQSSMQGEFGVSSLAS